jgi:hypothetical protein
MWGPPWPENARSCWSNANVALSPHAFTKSVESTAPRRNASSNP